MVQGLICASADLYQLVETEMSSGLDAPALPYSARTPGGVVGQQARAQDVVRSAEPRSEALRHHRVVVVGMHESHGMAHLVRQNAEERARLGTAYLVRLCGSVESPAVHGSRVGGTEDPVVDLAERDMRPGSRAPVFRIAGRPGLGVGGARQGGVGEADDDRLSTVILVLGLAEVAVTRDRGAQLQYEAAARDRVVQADHGLDVGVEPSEIGERRSTTPVVEVVAHAVAKQTHLDRARTVPFLSRVARRRLVQDIGLSRCGESDHRGRRREEDQASTHDLQIVVARTHRNLSMKPSWPSGGTRTAWRAVGRCCESETR